MRPPEVAPRQAQAQSPIQAPSIGQFQVQSALPASQATPEQVTASANPPSSVLSPPAASPQQAPTWRQPNYCDSPRTADEREICLSPQLSALDLQLQSLYDRLRGSLDSNRKIALRDEQRVWIKQRGACLNDDGCLLDTFHSRIAQLRSWH